MPDNPRVVVIPAPDDLNSNHVMSKLSMDGCGSVVSFLGITRGQDDGVKVEGLEFDAWEEKLPIVLRNLGENAISKFVFIINGS